jgi:ribonuclease-3
VTPDLDHFCRLIGYQFSDKGLLEQALTRRSVARQRNNERLEFLGDAVLGQVVAWWLYANFPQASEGQLTRMRASLVREDTLAAIARDLGFSDFLIMGMGDLKSGGHRRASILADALEAVIGAIALDSDRDACEGVVLRWFEQRLASVSPDAVSKDAKACLQEVLQARQQALPSYGVDGITGQSPHEVFQVHCRLEADDQVFRAEGSSRRRAEQKAAQQALRWLEDNA